MIFPANTGRAFVPIMSLNGLTGKLAGRFQSTLPVQGATTQIFPIFLANRFQSTLPVRGATCFHMKSPFNQEFQSTLPVRGATVSFSPLAYSRLFQSTLPVRGATASAFRLAGASAHFNPRSPYGERLDVGDDHFLTNAISIHAPRTGSDYFNREKEEKSTIFQSTLPVRGATAKTAKK